MFHSVIALFNFHISTLSWVSLFLFICGVNQFMISFGHRSPLMVSIPSQPFWINCVSYSCAYIQSTICIFLPHVIPQRKSATMSHLIFFVVSQTSAPYVTTISTIALYILTLASVLICALHNPEFHWLVACLILLVMLILLESSFTKIIPRCLSVYFERFCHHEYI